MRTLVLGGLFFILTNCLQKENSCLDNYYSNKSSIPESSLVSSSQNAIVDSSGRKIHTRFLPPEGYSRIEVLPGSFAEYLRNLPLKENGARVKYFNGKYKPNRGIYAAVVDLPVGKKDLHQCADAIIRLRAEFLYNQGRYDEIMFNFTNGFTVAYDKWRKGNRVRVKGNKVWWTNSGIPSNTYQSFWQYLETIFTYAGTISLSGELQPKTSENMKIGDVFIQGGSPGHAVIVVDMAMDKSSGRKVFLLAQSYMPAQEIQILNNPTDPDFSPWYHASFCDKLYTPEWTFLKVDLKSFE